MRALPLGCHVSTLTFLGVVVAVVAALAVVGIGYLVIRLVSRMRRRWKETQYERLDGQEEGSRCWCLDLGWIVSLLGGLFQRNPEEPQTERQDTLEEGQVDDESSPLLR